MEVLPSKIHRYQQVAPITYSTTAYSSKQAYPKRKKRRGGRSGRQQRHDLTPADRGTAAQHLEKQPQEKNQSFLPLYRDCCCCNTAFGKMCYTRRCWDGGRNAASRGRRAGCPSAGVTAEVNPPFHAGR